MRKALKVALVLLVLVVALAGGAAAYIHVRGIPTYPVEKVDLRVEVTAERVERGKKLAGMLCASCHLDPATNVLSGKRMPDVPPEFGLIYARNITKDLVHGIGS
jgi:hypothetical protein